MIKKKPKYSKIHLFSSSAILYVLRTSNYITKNLLVYYFMQESKQYTYIMSSLP